MFSPVILTTSLTLLFLKLKSVPSWTVLSAVFSEFLGDPKCAEPGQSEEMEFMKVSGEMVQGFIQ